MRYLFIPKPDGKHIRESVRGDLIEIPDGATVASPLPMLTNRADVMDYVDPAALPPAPPPPRPPRPRELSKLAIMQYLAGLGKWEAFKALLAKIPLANDAFWLASFILTDHPLFVAHKDDVQSALGLTEEQFAGLLAL